MFGAAQVVRSKLIGSRHFHGVDASGAGTRVILTDCHVSFNGKYGVVATHRAVVQLVACKSIGNAQAGVSAQERGEVRSLTLSLFIYPYSLKLVLVF